MSRANPLINRPWADDEATDVDIVVPSLPAIPPIPRTITNKRQPRTVTRVLGSRNSKVVLSL